MMSHALYLNSRDANTTTSDGSEAWFVLNNAGLMRRPGARFHIQVESITLPQAFYQTVRSGVNDAFAATVTDLADTPLASAVLTIVPGDYSASQLITAISTQWLASVLEASSGITITYSRTSKKLSFVPTTASRRITLTYATSTSAELTGLTADTTATTDTAVELGGVANMNSVTCVQVHSSLTPSGAYDSATGDRCNIVASVPVDRFGSILVHRAYGVVLQPIDVASISYIHLALRDERGRPVDNNGVSWSIAIRVQVLADGRSERLAWRVAMDDARRLRVGAKRRKSYTTSAAPTPSKHTK
jgi:hypothetical protein